jgi:hypothetical protein
LIDRAIIEVIRLGGLGVGEWGTSWTIEEYAFNQDGESKEHNQRKHYYCCAEKSFSTLRFIKEYRHAINLKILKNKKPVPSRHGWFPFIFRLQSDEA